MNINGNNYAATYNSTSWNYTFYVPRLRVGTYTWYCNASETGYVPQIGANQTYSIYAGYCNVSWAAYPGFENDFKGDHFAAAVNGTVHVAVNLTDGLGQPVDGISIPITPPSAIGTTVMSTLSVNGIATAVFSPLPKQEGSYYTLNTTAPFCIPPNCTLGVAVRTNLSTYINAHHDAAKLINVTNPASKVIHVPAGALYNISFEILDQFGNVCNSSYDGDPYNGTIAITQVLRNSSDANDIYTPWQCTFLQNTYSGPDNCYVLFNQSAGGGNEGKYTFQLYAYAPYPYTTIDNITNTLYEADFKQGDDPQTSPFAPTGKLTDDNVTVIYEPPPLPPVVLKVIAKPHQIAVNDSFNITIEAVYPNDTIDAANYDIVSVQRLQRADISQVTDIFIINRFPGLKLIAGNATFNVTSAKSLNWFQYTGLYTLYAEDDINASINGNGTLLVGAGGIDHLKVIVDPQGVFKTLPFTTTVYVEDVGNNTVENFTGDVSIVCPVGSTDPSQQNASLTPDDKGKTTFSFIAEQSVATDCMAYAYDSIHRRMVNTTFTVIMMEPLMCTPYAIPPIIPSSPPVDALIENSTIPPINQVIAHNDQIGNNLIGWDGTKMNGNYSICLESYHVGRLCINGSDIQFDKVPISVCVKEFVYNPQTDSYISDHINYNGSTDFDSSFVYPQILWGWGYNASDATYTANGMDANSGNSYSVKLTPGQVYTDFFNVTIALPLGSLQPYNITNESVLNPHELQAPSGLLVMDKMNSGRLAKFTLPTPPNPATFLEEYDTGITDTNAQAITYDNRGNVFVALTGVSKILILKVTKSYPPTVTFWGKLDAVTQNGTIFLPLRNGY